MKLKSLPEKEGAERSAGQGKRWQRRRREINNIGPPVKTKRGGHFGTTPNYFEPPDDSPLVCGRQVGFPYTPRRRVPQRRCARCGRFVGNSNLAGHTRKSALAGAVWCVRCVL